MCAMSLVTWSPAIGSEAVWQIAPCTNTAMSVVPAPMSTSTTPSSRSSAVSTATLDASEDNTRSSTCRPQRCTHLLMLAAADCAHTTRCACTSRRTPVMPTGLRMPSCESSSTYSRGIACRIFWSAGIATALAASSTRSRSPQVTSPSRIGTMPGEFLHCTWLPEMEAYTERISQPAISSASSTARWIDCTVDSISTTTPRLRPRDSWEPMPITSIGLPGEYSPTSATTLEVPISRPTISDLSPLRFMFFPASFLPGCPVHWPGRPECPSSA